MATLDGIRILELDELSVSDGLALLQAELVAANPRDPRAQQAEARQVVQLCASLPLAVRIAAAHLAAEPDLPIAELVAALSNERDRLEELQFDGSLAAATLFEGLSGRDAARRAENIRIEIAEIDSELPGDPPTDD